MKCATRLCSPLPIPSHPSRQIARDDGRKNEDLWWCCADGHAATLQSLETKSRLPHLLLGLVKLPWAMATAVEMVRWPVVEVSRHRRNDVSIGWNAGSLRRRRVSCVLELWVWRCCARLPNVLGSFLELSMTARLLVAGSLLVERRSSGR